MSRSQHHRFHNTLLYAILTLFLIVFATSTLNLCSAIGSADVIGVAYGRLGNDLPGPTQVVRLLQDNNVKRAMIYDTDETVLAAFHGSGISLIVQANNAEVSRLASSTAAAQEWVNTRIQPHAETIRYVAIGNELLTGLGESGVAAPVVEAMRNVHAALTAAGLSQSVQVSTTHAADILDRASFPPSSGRFRPHVRETISGILAFLTETGGPFMANVYPFLAYVYGSNDINLGYALLESGRGYAITDPVSGLVYTNLFDAQVDTLIYAMEDAGFHNVPILVTETGWPSAGHPCASLPNAQTYISNLISHLSDLPGTPKRPSYPISANIFALFNENQKPGPDYERHFGLFYPDQSRVYDIRIDGKQ